MPAKTVDIKEFARRVERLCDYLIGKRESDTGRDGSEDLKIVELLKEDAADIHMGAVDTGVEPLVGLAEFMKGAT